MSRFQLFKMPSPKNTNYEGFYIAKQTPLGPELAMDEKLKAKDAEPSAARGAAQLLKLLEARLGPEDFEELCSKLAGEPEEGEDEEMDDEKEMKAEPEMKAKDKRKTAKDAPPDFPGCPKTHAEDSANDKSFAWLNDAQRVKPDSGATHTDRSSQTRRAPVTANGERSFGEMYGAAALNIKGTR